MVRKRKNPNTRRRSKRAIAIDKAFSTTVTFPNTPAGRAQYRNYKGYADLRNFDTKTSSRNLERWNKAKKSSYSFESKRGEVSDYIDDIALTDSSLSARENKDNRRRQYRDSMRIF